MLIQKTLILCGRWGGGELLGSLGEEIVSASAAELIGRLALLTTSEFKNLINKAISFSHFLVL